MNTLAALFFLATIGFTSSNQDHWKFDCDTHYCYDAALWFSTNLVTIYIDGDTGKFQECHADNPPSIGVYTCKIIPGQTAYCPKSDGTWKKYRGHHWDRDCVKPYMEDKR